MALHDPQKRNFASDNAAGAHPEVLAAIHEANSGHVTSYGADPYTARLREVMKQHFGPDAEVFPVFNGTGANVVGLQAACPRWGAVICAQGSHIDTDECGAAERVAGLKLLSLPSPDGKLTPALVAQKAWGFGDEHHAQPAVVSITQSTEVGTTYTAEETSALSRYAHSLGMRTHLDGARLANAAASSGASLKELTTDAGIDIFSLGGTKNGCLFAEAVVVVDKALAHDLRYLRKMDMQLASKMRFLSAQLLALYEGDLWLRSARHANAMARYLADGLAGVPGVSVTQPVQANGVFAILPPETAARARTAFSFYDWDHTRGEVRLMCSFDTTEEDINALVRMMVGEDCSATE